MSVRAGKLLLSIDVEDWFQAENMSSSIPRSLWNEQEFRAETNIDKTLQLLDEFKVKATFFCLGWIAERLPKLIAQISDSGHEVASHGFNNRLICEQTPAEFREDITKAKALLEDIIGKEVIGYRAPTFSVTDWSLPIIQAAGYQYDSSVVITDICDRYGSVYSAAGNQPGDFFQIYHDLYEFSLPCLNFFSKSIPWGGGGYFRMFPLKIYLAGLAKILSEKDCVFYFNLWELDAHQPKISTMPLPNQFKHYTNLNQTQNKLKELIKPHAQNCNTFSNYLEQVDLAQIPASVESVCG